MITYAKFTTARINRASHNVLGLSYTASGYGSRIPTNYMVRIGARWHRVYCAQYANVGSLYIRSKQGKQWIDSAALDAEINR